MLHFEFRRVLHVTADSLHRRVVPEIAEFRECRCDCAFVSVEELFVWDVKCVELCEFTEFFEVAFRTDGFTAERALAACRAETRFRSMSCKAFCGFCAFVEFVVHAEIFLDAEFLVHLVHGFQDGFVVFL